MLGIWYFVHKIHVSAFVCYAFIYTFVLTLTVPVMAIDALQHFETG